MSRELLRMDEVAKRLGITLGRCYELARQKLLPVVRLGARQLRVDAEALERFIAEGGLHSPQPEVLTLSRGRSER
jgi:excisionase family DNA binding protein